MATAVFDLRQLKVHIARRGGWLPDLCWDVFGVLSSRRRDDTNRRTFQSRYYGLAHASTECLVHVHVTGVRSVQMDFVVVVHLYAPTQTAKPSAMRKPTALPYPPYVPFRDGNRWVSEPGSEVCCGLHLRPTLPLKEEGGRPDPTGEAYRSESAITAI